MPTVLVIDDCQFVRRVVSLMLEDEGCEVVCASDGREGVEAIQNRHVDVVITDIFMPIQDGIETIMRLRKQRPSLQIIAMSGGDGVDARDFKNIEPPYLRHAKLLGANHALIKPICSRKLSAALRACLPQP